MRALWSEVVLGLSLREWREQENVPPLISVTDSKGNNDHLHNKIVGTSEDRRGAIDLAIIREDLSRPQMFLRWVDGKAQVADALASRHHLFTEEHAARSGRAWRRFLDYSVERARARGRALGARDCRGTKRSVLASAAM